MRLNQRSDLKVMTIWISRVLPLFIFERLYILWASHIHPSQKLWPFEFVENFRFQFPASPCIMHLNRRSDLKVMTIWNSRELPLFIFERLNISWALHIHPSKKLWPFEFAESFYVQFQVSRYIILLNQTSKWKLMTIEISRELPLFNFEHVNISWASIIHPSHKLWSFEFVESFYL